MHTLSKVTIKINPELRKKHDCRVRDHGFAQALASHTSRISLLISCVICLNISMLDNKLMIENFDTTYAFSESRAFWRQNVKTFPIKFGKE